MDKLKESTSETIASTNEEYEIIDAEGHLLIPGMIDVHIHGANGFDMMDGTEESILKFLGHVH